MQDTRVLAMLKGACKGPYPLGDICSIGARTGARIGDFPDHATFREKIETVA